MLEGLKDANTHLQVALQRKMFAEYERRDKARKVGYMILENAQRLFIHAVSGQ